MINSIPEHKTATLSYRSAASSDTGQIPTEIDTYLGPALVAFFVSVPFGAVALTFSLMSEWNMRRRQWRSAARWSTWALVFCWIALPLTFVCLPALLLFAMFLG